MSGYPVQYEITHVRAGDDWRRTLVFKQNGEPYRLDDEGWVDWLGTWRSAAGPDISIPVTIDASEANDGILTVSLTGAQVASMTRSGWWSLQSRNPTKGIEFGRTWLIQPMAWHPDWDETP